MWAVVTVMFLQLARNRGTLVLAFVLPPIVYVLFAAIFSATAGDDLKLRLVIFDAAQTDNTLRLIADIEADGAFRKAVREPTSPHELSEMIKLDEADVGLLLRDDPAKANGADAKAPLLVIGDAAKAVAAPIAMGQIQRIIAERMPDVAYRRTFAEIEQSFVPLEPQQKARVDAILKQMRTDVMDDKKSEDTQGGPVIARETIKGRAIANPSVVYYAGATAMMFLLFASLQGAMQLIDERQSGVMDRVLSGMHSGFVLVAGKFLFLMAQGILQVSLIFAAAALIYKVDVLDVLPAWIIITVAGAALAAACGLAMSAACRTRQQAQTLSTFIILILSAVGGSMVPRFMMPEWLQKASWASPNAWVIEAYHGLLWRGAAIQEVLWLVAPTMIFAALCLVSAMALLHVQAKQ
jgi:ABC-2 type transport system permease protein